MTERPTGGTDSSADQHHAPSELPGNCMHPGNLLLTVSLPLLALAYRDFHAPLESSLKKVLREQRVSLPELPNAEEATRRAVAVAVASRALRTSALISCGVFGFVTALAFYSTGCSTLDQAVQKTQRWAFQLRGRLDLALEVQSRVDANHPEMEAIRGMDEQEELSYVGKTFLSDWHKGLREKDAD